MLYGEWDQRQQRAHWFTVDTDGSNRRDLHVVATCAEWFPDGSRIFITNDAAVDEAGAPLRPAVIEPDGSDLTPLDATRDPDLQLGCGDVSPDGSRIVLEGFNLEDPSYEGIYSVRASDGGGLLRLTDGPDVYPQYSPDGSRVVFMRTKSGVNPDGAGALFVVNADGADLRRITPWGFAFLDQAWSPDGSWIVFQRPYGRLFLVHPDGTGLHEVPVELPKGSGAREPSWSPDGAWIVFALDRGGSSNVYAVRPDGTGLTRITDTHGTQDSGPDWRP
jgi:Tol biopolymer transport system component